MRILIVSTSFPCAKTNSVGGRFIQYEAQAYALNGASVKVLTPHFLGSPEREHIDKNLDVVRFRYFPAVGEKIVTAQEPVYVKKNMLLKILSFPFFAACFAGSILKHAHQADIIHCSWTVNVLFALPAKYFLRKKIVVTARGSDIRMFPKWLNRFIMRRVDASVDCYGPQPWTENLKREFPSRYLSLPLISGPRPTVSECEYLKDFCDSDQLRILYFGRLDEVKINIHKLPVFDLIEALHILSKQGIPVKLAYIGVGSDSIIEKMKDLISKYALEDRIFILGYRRNPQNFFCNFDLGVGGEAFITVTQEFVSNDLPQLMVSSEKNEGTPWQDGVNCLMAQANSAASIADKIKYAAANRGNLTRISNNAKLLLKDLIKEPNEGGKSYLAAFKQLLDGNKSD